MPIPGWRGVFYADKSPTRCRSWNCVECLGQEAGAQDGLGLRETAPDGLSFLPRSKAQDNGPVLDQCHGHVHRHSDAQSPQEIGAIPLIDPHSHINPPRRRATSMISSAITTTPNWPIPPAWTRRPWRPGCRRANGSAASWLTWTLRQHGAVSLVPRDRPRLPRLRGRPPHRSRRRWLCDEAEKRMAQPDWESTS